MKSYALIVNPVSGRGRALRKAEALRGFLSVSSSVEVLHTTRRGSAIELAAGSARRVDRVIAVGGDGTLNEVINGLMTAGLPYPRLPELGFLPAGTANVAVRAFHLGSDPASVSEALGTAESKPLDVGVARYAGGERAFLLWFGAGWDAVVIRALNSSRSGMMGLSGLLGHAPQIVTALAAYDQPPIATQVDGSSFGTHSTVIVANVGQIGLGGSVAETADPRDARLDIVGVPHLSLLGSIRPAFQMMTASLTRARGVSHRLGAEVSLQSDGDVPFHLDGEPVGTLPATVTVAPGAVRFLRT